MPIYEYQCEKCGIFETIQKFNDQPLAKCPTCQSSNPQKIVSASAFHLKGAGWYKSDYGSSTKSTTNGSTSAQDKASETPEVAPAKCNTGCKCH